MSDLNVIGVDVGSTGAIALLTADGDLIEVEDMPVLNDGPAGRKAVNAPLLSALLWKWSPGSAFVELVGARPKESSVGAFAFGRSRGVIEGVLGAMDCPVRMIAPVTWKRIVGLPSGEKGAKDASRSEAIRRWPAKSELFRRAKDDGRADACLIGIAGLMKK